MHIVLDNHFYKAWRSEKEVSLAILGRSYTTCNADVPSGIALTYSKLRRGRGRSFALPTASSSVAQLWAWLTKKIILILWILFLITTVE